jgi:hypothetical protein
MRKILLLLILFFPVALAAQSSLKDIKNPGSNRVKKCKKYYQVYQKLPLEARYNVKVVNGEIIFFFPSEEIFKRIFDKKYDGIAIDIVSRDQFNCTKGNQPTNSWAYKGELLPPIFKKELEERMIIDENKNVFINYGSLPTNYDPFNVECNMLLLQKKFHCGYHSFSNIDYSQWDLLDMGLYRDSIPEAEYEQFQILKKLKIQIPFEKNQHKFQVEDIQPLYDSLHLTDFNIKEISIEAFTSVEGTTSNNFELQNARAKSIVDALQSYQNPEIKFHITALENWEEFLSDIEGTQFQYLSQGTQPQIKRKLEQLRDSKEMNSILSSHRKAIITMQLERKVSIEQNPNELALLFGQSVIKQNLEEALYIQNFVFEQIKSNKLPESFLGKLEIPHLSLYSPLINNEVIFEYENSKGLIADHIKSFEELLKILPKNPQITYNLVALKLRASTSNSFPKHRKEIWALINSLSWKIDKSLLARLRINYHILNTEYLDNRKKFREKNKSLKQVYSSYKNLELTDWELLYLSRFLSIYSQFKWAETVTKTRVYEGDAILELVDYYFRLTIDDDKKLKSSQYISLIERTLKTDKQTFCNLFLPTEQGGYTFQLLSNESLADIYCKNCQGNDDDL